MRYYPVFLNLKERLCVVVGGGDVAERKVRGLLRAGARVKVVSPELTEGLEELRNRGLIKHVKRAYQEDDIRDAFLVIAATSEMDVNRAVFKDARNVPVNVVDVPELCSFIVPSIVNRGDLTVAISTSGVSPALARSIREELEVFFPEETGEFLEFLKDIRSRIKQTVPDSTTREAVLKEIGSRRVLKLLLTEGVEVARQEVYGILNKRGIKCE